MKKIKIRKRKGTYRLIYACSQDETKQYREILSELEKKDYSVALKHAHGFCHDRNIVTAAKVHIRYNYTLSFDLADFFDSVSETHLKNYLKKEVLDKCLIDGAPRQGLPTSPLLANLAASKLDVAITKKLGKEIKGGGFAYTRYADDIAISFQGLSESTKIKKVVSEAVRRCGFKLNKKKTRLHQTKTGKRVILGVSVDAEGVSTTRSFRRRLRAAEHNLSRNPENKRQGQVVAGMKEFLKLKEPGTDAKKQAKTDEKRFLEAQAVAKYYHLRSPKRVEKVISEKTDGEYAISNDPVTFYLFAAATLGRSTCLDIQVAEKRKKYAGGVWLFQHLPGCSLACLFSDEQMKTSGVKQRKMIARCYVYQTRETGKKLYGHLYGHKPGDTEKLRAWLEKQGFQSCTAGSGETVCGHTRCGKKPYFDNLKIVETRLKEKKGNHAVAWKFKIM